MSDLRRSAEHEAAHAVTAAHFGVEVYEVRALSTGEGLTRTAPRPAPWNAAITAAGDLWEAEFSRLPYVDGYCGDLAQLERAVGASGVWQARRDARAVLTRRRRDVLALADRLEAHGVLVGSAGRLIPATTTGARR